MAECPSCKAEGYSPGAACAVCGVRSLPELELDIPAPRSRASAKTKAAPRVEPISLDLKLDLPDLPDGPLPGQNAEAGRKEDEGLEARTLADYGPTPTSWLGAPKYAYRVWKRQRELRAALVARREEAALAQEAATDALVACGERARKSASKEPAYGTLLQELKAREDILRSRDQSLAKEQEAHAERVAAIDGRIARLEEELSEVTADEHVIVEELAQADAARKRSEAKAKRAEIEIRTLRAAAAKSSQGAAS